MQPPARPQTPSDAWKLLEEGNDRFVRAGRSGADTGASRRLELTHGQSPFALTFSCSDSRVPAEFVFDQGLGDLFVIRTAGHVVDTAVLGSVEFGVGALGIGLVVVLGHEECGAVKATTTTIDEGSVPSGYVRDLVERITPSVLSARRAGAASPREVEAEHVRLTARLLVERSSVLAEAVRTGRCAVVGVTYALSTGRVRRVDALGDLPDLPDLDGVRASA